MFYMIREMSFKCLILLTVLPSDVFNPIKSLQRSDFAKIVNEF